jgi:hypothetical protein
MLFASNNLDKLIFMKKNGSSDPMISCKYFSNLVELIEIDAKTKELEEFEFFFERDEILEV